MLTFWHEVSTSGVGIAEVIAARKPMMKIEARIVMEGSKMESGYLCC